MWRSSTDPAATALLVVLLLACPAAASPWGHEPGHGFAKVGLSRFSTGEGYQLGLPTGLSYEALTFDLYAEVGLPWRLTVIADVPYVIATNRGANGVDFVNHTFGDSRFELDYRLTERWPLALGVETKVPLYSLARDRGTAGLVDVDGTLWSASNFPDVGDGNTDLTFKAMAGTSLPALSGWAAAMVGYQKRFGPYVDSFVGSLSAGLDLWRPYLSASIFASGSVNLQQDAAPAVVASREHFYLQGELSVGGFSPLPGLRLGVSLGGVLVAANSARGTTLATSLSYKR